MRLVIDNNIFFSLMNPSSIASYIFFSLNAEIFVPEYIKYEFEKYKKLCLSKSKLSKHQFELRKEEIKEKIEFIKLSVYKKFLKQSAENLHDPKDSSYLALALRLKIPIWSNDSHFKQQSLIKVFTTKELIKKLLNKEI